MKNTIIFVVAVLIVVGVIGYGIYQSGSLENREALSQKKMEDLKIEHEKELTKAISQHYQHNLLSPGYVVSYGLNTDLMAQLAARATFPIFYSVGESLVKSGKVTILGKETLTDGKEYYVGFTTACAVTLDYPWEDDIKKDKSKLYNQIFMIKPTDSDIKEDFYLKIGSEIEPDKGIALLQLTQSAHKEKRTIKVSARGTGGDISIWTGGGDIRFTGWENLEKGSYVEIFAEGQWSIRDSGKKCGPEGEEGKRDYTIDDKFNSGCLLIGVKDTEDEDFAMVTGYKKGGVGFFMRKSELWFLVNDEKRHNNTGNIDVGVRIRPGLDLERIKRDSVKIKSYGRNDVRLIYFPIHKDNYFGSKKPEEIASLGLTNPTVIVNSIIKNSTYIFGHQFFLHCERCDEKIRNVPKILREIEAKLQAELSKKVQEAYELGKRKGVTLFVAGLVKPLTGLLGGLVYKLLPEDTPEMIKQSTASMVTGLLFEKAGTPLWDKYIRPNLSEWNPELEPLLPLEFSAILEEVLPHEVSLDQIQDISSEGLLLKDNSVLELAGLSVKEGQEQDFVTLLKGLLSNANKLMVVPYGKEGDQTSVHLLADDNYINQLLLLEGVAEPDKKDKEFPFREDFLRSEQEAKQKRGR